ncbi:hypothetical protein PS15m_002761 [Mucor circinelloides]
MKLRNNARRVAIVIKREEQREDIIKLEAAHPQCNSSQIPSFTVTNDTAINIKKEDSKDYISIDHINQEKSLTHINNYAQGFNGDTKNYYYQCHLCKEVKDSLQSVSDHRKTIHNMRGFRIIKRIDIEPNINDPNNFCQTCEKTYTDKIAYRKHLRSTHHMVLKHPSSMCKSNLTPDPENPDFYCCSCCRTYQNLHLYRNHLKSYHRMQLPSLCFTKNPGVLPDSNDPHCYCKSCNKVYRTVRIYRIHCLQVHNMKRLIKKVPRSELPDLENPDFYCKTCNITHQTERAYRTHCNLKHKQALVSHGVVRLLADSNKHCNACDRTFSNKGAYGSHLFVVHKINDETKLDAGKLKPDIDDPNYYCRSCDRTLSSKDSFQSHVRQRHGMGLSSQTEREQKLDINETTNYCCVCKRTYSNNLNYRRHLIIRHGMRMPSYKKRNHKYLPDPLDPNWYCRACKIQWLSSSHYRQHCKRGHHMTLPSINGKRNRAYVYPDAEINTQDPNHHCAKCDKVFKARHLYGSHLRRVHKLRLLARGGKQPDPNATIDLNDPNFYCAQCGQHFSAKKYFNIHINLKHKSLRTKHQN